MSGYPEGKHDDPADTQDRLIKVGTKYNATAPNVADGDNVYLLVDSAGRPIVVGPAAENAAVVGNPLLAGGRYDATDRTLGDGDVGGLALDVAGRVKVAGPSSTAPVAAMPGASEVKTEWKQVVGTSATRDTFITPTSGKKIRIISVNFQHYGMTTDPDRWEIYFGTGVNISSTTTKAIGAYYPGASRGSDSQTWPDGAGPVGAADDVVSWRATTEAETAGSLTVHYREE